MPVLFGTFLKNTPLTAVAGAAVSAVVVHFGLYYTGQHYFPYFMDVAVNNPGLSAAVGIQTALVVGGMLHLMFSGRKPVAG